MTRRKVSTTSQPGGSDQRGAGEPKSPTIAGPRYEDPKREHKPKTGGKEESVYVLTLKLSDEIAGAMNEMREQWFPKHLNRTPAHLTLFHALPHSQLETIESYLGTAASYMKPFRIVTGSPFRMRRGVGIGIRSGVQEAKVLHDGLRNEWIDFLSDQDSGGWRPHWTVMNKENDAERVKEAFETLDESLKRDEIRGVSVGMDLWKYNKGDWDFFKEYKFVGDERGQYSSDTSVPAPSVAAGHEQNSNSSHLEAPVKGRRMSK
jgi:2'-5' RNA ligase